MSDATIADDAKVLAALLAAYGPVECERLSRRATSWRVADQAQACAKCAGSPIVSALLRVYPIAVDPKLRG